MELYKTNKAQVTLMIIVGMLLLFLLVLVVAFSSIDSVDPAQEQSDIKRYIESCLSVVSDEGLRLAAVRGGVIEPGNTIKGFEMKKGKINKTLFEKEVENYIENQMHRCKEEEQFHPRELSYSEPKADVLIGMDSVSVQVDMNVKITDRESTSSLNRFTSDHYFKLGFMIEVMNKTIDCFNPEYLKTTGLEAKKHPEIITLKGDNFYLAAGY